MFNAEFCTTTVRFIWLPADIISEETTDDTSENKVVKLGVSGIT